MLFPSLPNATFYSEAFSHDRETKVISAEASTLGLRKFDQIYSDACDVGLLLYNSKNMNKTYWYLHEEFRNHEGELTHWELWPCPESVRKNPTMSGYKMLIWND